MAEPYYATVAELRADPDVPDSEPPTDATLEALIVEAEDLVDRLIGPRDVRPDTGRKYDATDTGGLTAGQRDALRRATLALAAEAYADPMAFLPPAGGSISGPDFSVSNPAPGTPRGRAELRRVAGLLDANALRVTRARVL